MYSIMLVDDEQDIRQSIIELVQWEKMGFQIIGEASNGEEALEVMESNVPDILITDIKMPIMDGIELSKRVRDENPSVKIVFLSGYEDFEYAVSGIKLTILEYLLKPVSISDLENMLRKVRRKLDEEKRSANDLVTIEKDFLKKFDVSKMSFLISLITDNYSDVSESEFKKLLQTYQLNLTGERQVLLNITIDKSSFSKSTIGNQNLELTKFSLTNTVRKIVDKYVQSEVFTFTSNSVVILSDTKENIEMYTDILVKEINESVQKIFGFSIGIGVSEEYVRISDTKRAFQSSVSALNYQTALGGDKGIYISDIETVQQNEIVFDEVNEAKLVSLIKIGSKDELETFIDHLFQRFYSGMNSQEHLKIFLMELYVSVLKAYKTTISKYDSDMLQQVEVISEIHHYQDNQVIKEWFKNFCLSTIAIIQEQRKKKTDSLAKQSYDYLAEHYSDPSLSLKQVSKQMLISPSYFSSLFKKENGLSFTDALVKIRMEKAKEHLLTTDHKIFEIAIDSGYTDQHYFSYCFKKYFGESPNKIRETFKKNKLLVETKS
ncbi:response regulator transcription factor [Carnobacterium antarcticum]|uniref:Response regulator n=1 Tax=Carnobacterium antarcticum TaxID=2126436 RepID=A0ABW4NP63_9LACT|nr:response regulator [Carnobacterium sp. CP1]ALV21817.1 Two-component response regulator yesN, associated with MetSO reductase [Carnobacterium sp. CP1]